MNVYLLIAFLNVAPGGITAHASPQLYIGADQCQAQAALLVDDYTKQGYTADQMRVLCVDSRMFVGEPA